MVSSRFPLPPFSRPLSHEDREAAWERVGERKNREREARERKRRKKEIGKEEKKKRKGRRED